MSLNHGKKNLEQERRQELNTVEPVQWLSEWIRAAKRDSLNSTQNPIHMLQRTNFWG